MFKKQKHLWTWQKNNDRTLQLRRGRQFSRDQCIVVANSGHGSPDHVLSQASLNHHSLARRIVCFHRHISHNVTVDKGSSFNDKKEIKRKPFAKVTKRKIRKKSVVLSFCMSDRHAFMHRFVCLGLQIWLIRHLRQTRERERDSVCVWVWVFEEHCN